MTWIKSAWTSYRWNSVIPLALFIFVALGSVGVAVMFGGLVADWFFVVGALFALALMLGRLGLLYRDSRLKRHVGINQSSESSPRM